VSPHRLPDRLAAGWPAALLAGVSLAFLAMPHLPSFDTPKLVLLLAGATLLGLAAWRARGKDARDGVAADPILLVPFALAAVATLGALAAWPSGSLAGPAAAFGCLAVARLVAQSADPRRAVRTVARGAASAAALAGAYAFLQKAGFDFTPWALRREPVATFGNTSFAAEFQAAALPLSLLLAVPRDAHRGDRILGWAAAAIGAAHLVLARSRIDFVAVAAALVAGACLLLVARGRGRAAAGVAAIGVALAAGLGVAFASGAEWLGRSDTVAVRASIWRATSRMVADAPLRVAGEPFVSRFPEWREPNEYRTSMGRRVDTPHDDWLELAAALGVPGLIAALGVAALLARRVVAVAREHGAEAAALGASLVALAVSALASSPLSHPATALLPALAAGLVVALAPRPWRGWTPPARTIDAVAVVLAAAALWPGPAWRGLRSDGFLALGLSELDGGDPVRALNLLDAAAAVDPQAYDARYQLGTLLKSAGQRDKAVEALESARDLRPGDFECRVNLAYALRDAGRRDDAHRVVDDALVRCPWHPLLLAARAIFELDAGRAAESLADARRAAAGLPNDARLAALAAEARLVAEPSEAAYVEALDALGLVREREGVEEFARSVRSMLRRDATLLGPLVARARRIAPTDPDHAAALVLAAAAVAGGDAGFLDDASRVLRDTGHPRESAILLGRSLGVRAAEAFARGENGRALKLAEQAAERDATPAHHLLAARAAASLGERESAIQHVGAAVAAGPVDADAVRGDPAISRLFPDPRLDDLLDCAAKRSGEIGRKPGAH
jgi:tetratricopeptide (TPR) repeat protein/O-antigen ligase